VIQVSAEEAATASVCPDRPAMPVEILSPTAGAFFTTAALKRRFGELKDRTAFKEVDRYQQMIKEYSSAIQETAEQTS
jgi:hypothetical protein